ncbi:MAG TPA: TaqI-like C-terminal specificity domain-containing protein [Herpetosiphonaceae bacterium]
MPAPDFVIELIERFHQNAASYRSGRYNETQVRVEFINPLFEALGWDIQNKRGLPQDQRDVIHEDSIKVRTAQKLEELPLFQLLDSNSSASQAEANEPTEMIYTEAFRASGGTKAPDYGFRVGGERKFFLEAKKPSVNIKGDIHPAFQLRRYGWSANLPLSILTDFEEFAVYDCRVRPEKTDKAAVARMMYLTYTEYVDKWDDIAKLFSRESVLSGSLDAYIETATTRKGLVTVDAAFLKEIEDWRAALAHNIAVWNKELSQRELNYAVQMTIDRIIFLRICEDRGIEPYGRLQAIYNRQQVYAALSDLFRQADDRYNSGLFHFKKEKGRSSSPDDWTLNLYIEDEPLQRIIRHLYYPDSPYEFSVLPIELLGQVYEQFLGKVIHLSSDRRAIVEEKPEVRKAGGVYYTPSYIVDYIVKHTVGKLLEGKSPTQVSKLRILDPSCGSGSFLIGAYQYLLDWHRDYYLNNGPGKHKKELIQVSGGVWRLTTGERRRILLNNIYGVDIDTQAVEVTKLSLLLKVLEGETEQTLAPQLRLLQIRALPDLGSNIKCGNSLIGPDFYRYEQMNLLDEEERYRINVFDWDSEFPTIMQSGGFDAVIGNPPYIFTRELLTPAERNYFSEKYATTWEKQNTFMLFMELMLRLMNSVGLGGFIVPNSWLTIESAKLLRKVFTPRLTMIADLNYVVFNKVSMEPSIFIVGGSDSDSSVHVLRVTSKEEFLSTQAFEIDRARWSTQNHRIVFSRSSDGVEVVDKVVALSQMVGDAFDVRSGLQAYEQGRGNPPQTEEDVRNHIFDRDQWVDKDSFRYLQGRDVLRYRLEWSGMWMQYGPWLSQPREFEIFRRPRLLLREITSNYPYCMNAAYVSEDFLNNKSILNVLHPHDDVLDLKILLGILNSRLTSLFYKHRAVKSSRKLFPKVVIKNLREFPYPRNMSTTLRSQCLTLVERMLVLQQQAVGARTSYDRGMLQRQVGATNVQIDRLVYELYDLTDEEIKIVEADTKGDAPRSQE